MAKKITDELLNHEYDGIEEFDNDLPPWWLNLFYVTIAFAFMYFIYYHVAGQGPDQVAEYQAEVKEVEKLAKASGSGQTQVNLVAYKDETNLNAGKEVFTTNCTACHGQNAQGDVGPNLTDEFWIHGGKFANIVNTITQGVPEKGMVTWGGVLKPEQIHQVASYVVSLQGSQPANPKAPQGEKVDISEIGQ